MIEPALISVEGPTGSGKTTFIEHVLRSARRPAHAFRCLREPDLDGVHESSPTSHSELSRYRAAGAIRATEYRFPEPSFGAFLPSIATSEPADVLLEGASPVEHPNLVVFVAPVPAPRKRLLRRVKRDLAPEHQKAIIRMRSLLRTSKGTLSILRETFGAPMARLVAKEPEIVESCRASLEANLHRLAPVDPTGRRTDRWEVARPYRGIEKARLVLFNIRDASERRRGEAAQQDVRKFREDSHVFQDVLGQQGYRVPIMIVSADLGHDRDAGLRKAIRRVLRVCTD